MATATLEKKETQPEPFGNWLGNPFAAMRRLADEMDRYFWGRRDRMPELFGSGLVGGWTPDIEVVERKGQFVVRADLPGLTKDDVRVEITDDHLTIEGERKSEKEEKGQHFYACERSYGRFFRSLPLPEGTKTAEAKATFKNGVLEIEMPAPQLVEKAKEKAGRKLEIKS